MVWVQILAVIIGLAVLVATLIFVLKTKKGYDKIDADPNAQFIDTPYRTDFTEGHCFGLIKRNLPRKNGCNYVEMIPIDNFQSEDSAKNTKIKPISFIIKRELLKPMGRGEYSYHREVMKTLPPPNRPQSIPEKMRDTDEGKWAKVEMQKAFLENTFGTIHKTTTEAIARQVVDVSTIGLTRLAIEQMHDANKKTQLPLYPEKQPEQKP